MNKKFAEHLNLDYPILSDPTKSVARAFGVLAPGDEYALRWTFVIGVDGKILDVMKNVSAGSHGHDLAVHLGELGVAKKK